MTRRDETRLFAMLLKDEFNRRCYQWELGDRYDQFSTPALRYQQFLRKNAESRHSNCYAVALSMISGDAR